MQYSELRGFNYQPGYSAHLQYTWTNFDRAAWEREVPFSLRFGANVLRVWLDWSAFLAVGKTMLDALEEALTVLSKHGLRMMPVLFNRWTDARYPAGGVSNDDLKRSDYAFRKFRPYVEGIMERFAQDERVFMWDLCNEPQAPGEAPEISLRETVWLMSVADTVRGHSPTAPITIGSMTYDYVSLAAPLVDVISFHPYANNKDEMKKLCEDHLEIARMFGKPLICTETCKGSLDDEERGRLARSCIETLERYDIGWLAWQLVEGQFVTASRDRTDTNAVRPNEGYMPFVLADGSTRPGHEWLENRQRRDEL